METNFMKFRKWCRWQKAYAVLMILANLAYLLADSFFEGGRPRGFLWLGLAALACAYAGFQARRYARCPYCGKCALSFWGRDGAGRNGVRRIECRHSILCAKCGAEIETDERFKTYPVHGGMG